MNPYTQTDWRVSLRSFGKQLLVLLGGILLYSVGFAALAWTTWKLVSLATRFHWLTGLSVILAVLIILLWGLGWIRRAPLTALNFGQYPRIGLALNLILIAASSMLVMTFISDILFKQGLAQYTSAQPVTIDSLFAYYGWHLVDAIPVFDVWSVIDWEAPLEGQGVTAGLLLQAFLVLVIAASIEIFQSKQASHRDLLRFAKALRAGATDYKHETAPEMARRSLNQALPLAERHGGATDQIDIHLEYARLLIETGEADGARAALEKAGNLIDQETQRRDLERRRREVAELQGRLEAGNVRAQAGTAE